MNFSDSKLYACGEEGGHVAGLVRWDPPSRVITWVMPGGRQRAYEVAELVRDGPDVFEFVDPRGLRFELVPLTPSFYNDHIRQPEQPRLTTDAQLFAAYKQSLA